MKKLVVLLLLPLMVSSQTISDNYMEKKVIAKTIHNGYYDSYAMALEGGDTYYCDFGFYSMINIGDIIVFKKNWLGRYKYSHVKHLIITEMDGETGINWYSDKPKRQ